MGTNLSSYSSWDCAQEERVGTGNIGYAGIINHKYSGHNSQCIQFSISWVQPVFILQYKVFFKRNSLCYSWTTVLHNKLACQRNLCFHNIVPPSLKFQGLGLLTQKITFIILIILPQCNILLNILKIFWIFYLNNFGFCTILIPRQNFQIILIFWIWLFFH